MDHKFTESLRIWLETTADERDYAAGALMLLRLSGNQIMYRNALANPDKMRPHIEYQLQKYYNFRVADLTHEQVSQMATQVAEIAINLDLESDTPAEEKMPVGKRADHDSLPDDIKALYIENLPILRRMRELHLRLRTLSLEDATCPDSERYPFLKELIALDKKMHSNWEKYDRYVP